MDCVESPQKKEGEPPAAGAELDDVQRLAGRGVTEKAVHDTRIRRGQRHIVGDVVRHDRRPPRLDPRPFVEAALRRPE